MSDSRTERVRARVERKCESLPRFAVVPAVVAHRLGIAESTVVECTISDRTYRRTLKRWDDARWFFDLPDALCKRERLTTGKDFDFTLSTTEQGPPAELVTALEAKGATTAWKMLSAARRRMLAEHVRSGVRPSTRERRATKIAVELKQHD